MEGRRRGARSGTYELVTKEPLPQLNLSEVRGMEGIKEAQVKMVPPPGSKFAELVAARAAAKAVDEAAASAAAIKWEAGAVAEDDGQPGVTLRVAVAHELGNAKTLITKMQSGEATYDFVEIMACPGGCVGGGGQPRSTDKQIAAKRQAALYNLDERSTIRRSHENTSVQEAYRTYLGEPNSHKAHILLHIHYVAGEVKNEGLDETRVLATACDDFRAEFDRQTVH